jgi:serine/threonine protein kinase
MPSLSSVGSATLGRVEEIVAHFEAAWQAGSRPQIETLLPEAPRLRALALVELVHRELELCLKAGEPIRVEDYLHQFPELAADDEAVLGLLIEEFHWRHRADPNLDSAEYARRFPRLAQALAERLSTRPHHDPSTLPPLLSAGAWPRGHTDVPLSAGKEPVGEGKRYRPVRPHARGGLGEVLIADDAQLGRQVALKRIQERWRHDPESRRRFVREAELTGRLEHPGVVPVYSLAEDEQAGLCYAMRFVEGETLQQAIEGLHATGGPANRLAFRQLLGRFVAVCQTVAYAHSKGVVHRDLKPANLLIGKYGETLVADWGLAKQHRTAEGAEGAEEEQEGRALSLSFSASSAPSAVSSPDTLPGQVVGTPAYMAPEQASPDGGEIGPPADIFGLGATLYHLLTGRPPYRGSDPTALLELARRTDFPRPRSVRRDLPRALEAVCMKALAAKSAERYASATDLAADLERWLADEPVTAHRESLPIRLMRAARRHPAALSAAGMLLLAGVVGLALGLTAVHAEERRTSAERDRATRQAARAEALNHFLLDDLLAEAAPDRNPREKNVTVAEVLDKAAARVESRFPGQPQTEADVRLAVGRTYQRLSKYEQARPQMERALALRTQRFGPDHQDTLEARAALATVLHDLGQPADAERLLRENAATLTRRFGAEHPDTLEVLGKLAGALDDQGKLDEAEALFRDVLDAFGRVLGPNHPRSLSVAANFGLALKERGRLAEAEPILRDVVDGYRETFGPEDPTTLTAENNLAALLQDEGKLAEAEPLYRHNLDACRRVQGPDHADTLTAAKNLALLLRQREQLPEAEALFRQNLEALRRTLGPDHFMPLAAASNLADVLRDRGELGEAEGMYRQNLADRRRVLGMDHQDTLNALIKLARLLRERSGLAEAERLAREALTRSRRVLPDGDPTRGHALAVLGEVLTAAGRTGEAEPLLRECLEERRRTLLADHWLIAAAEGSLGECLAARKQYAEAEALLLRAAATLDTAPVGRADRRQVRQQLVQLYEAWGKGAEAERWKQQAAGPQN